MKPILKAAMAGLLTAAIAGGGMLGLAGAAFAAGSAPSWEPDGNAAAPYGNLTFYDANGNQVTSGTGDLSNPFSYVVASTAGDTGATKASVAFYNPQHGVVPASWTGTAEAGPTTFSPATSLPSGTPADIAAFAPTYPVTAAASADISTWISANVPDTTAGYANTVQVRLTDSGPHGAGNASGTYWESDIGYNTTSSPITVDGTAVPADGWAVLFPFVSATTTSLTTSATGGNLTTGNPITLTATVSSTGSGAVQFYDGATILADSTTPGSGTYTYSYTPAAGTHVYTASFVPGSPPGDETGAGTATASFVEGSTSSAVTVQDTAPATGTTTALSPSSTSITFGQSVTLTATVSASDSTNPAGSVEFLDGTTAITGCSAVAINPPSSAQCITTALPLGSDSITAVFTPTSSSYASSTSSAVVVTVTGIGTTTALSAGSSSLAAGASDTFTATVGATDNSTTGVTGSVGFLDGTTPVTDCTAQATTVTGDGTTASPAVGKATCTTSSLLMGSDSITAVFTPTDTSYATSTSAAVAVTAAQTGTTIALSTRSRGPAFGASVTFTASVGATDNSTAGVTGSVGFLDGTTSITGCTAQATTVTGDGTTASPGVGTATCTTSSLPLGSDTITAVFTPTDSSYATLPSSPVGVTVGEASSTTALNFSSDWITYGDEGAEVLSVSISPEFAGSTPAGAVTVTDSGSSLCAITLADAKGSCTLSATQLDVGSYYGIIASYGGSTDFAGSSSTTGSLTVAPASSTTTLSISALKVAYGNEGAEKLAVSVTPEFPGSTPTGFVRVSDSSTTLCAITLSAGAGSCTLSARKLPVGGHGLTATYGGSIDFNSSASVSKGLAVSKETSKVALKLSSSKVTFGHETSEHLSVKVSPEFAGSIPNGKVTVRISSTTLCVISLSPSGTGSYTLSARKLSAGIYGLVASYSGSSDFGTSAAPRETLKVVT